MEGFDAPLSAATIIGLECHNPQLPTLRGIYEVFGSLSEIVFLIKGIREHLAETY